jgi:glutamyl-tRNA(Gln) amidotransferase subunit E
MRQQFALDRSGGLENIDFQALGFKCGLEIHHQIKTEKKLFCHCPAGKYSDEYQAEVLRHMRPTLSELGVYDGCALMEFKTKKEIIYRLNKESVCTYEMDDNPPFPINRQALDIAIEIALLLNCKIVGEIHIARKQYLDGSIPTGFQRTTIVGVDGWVPYKARKIGIIQLALEEDACREVSDIGHRITFITDRLSMPLIEVVTAPDMKDPLEAAEVGGLIGTMLRLTGKVNRGAGAVRQDVNVSVTGGSRVEIKGVPRLGLIPRLTGFEAGRQKALLNLRDEIKKRGIQTDNDIVCEIKDLSSLIGKLNHPPLRERFPQYRCVKAVRIKDFGGVFAFSLNPGWNFAQEVSARLRVIACLDIMPNIAHTDPDDDLSLTLQDRRRVFDRFKCDEKDLVVIIWGPPEDVDTGISEIIIRAKEILQGVINETRQYRPSGLSDFERILPGPDRMYPDTDSPPTAITDEQIAKITENLPETPWKKLDRFQKWGIPSHISWKLLHSPFLNAFEKAVETHFQHSAFFTELVIQIFPKEFRRNGYKPNEADIVELLIITAEKSLAKEEVVELIASGKECGSWQEALSRIKTDSPSDETLIETIKTVLDIYKSRHIPMDAIIGEVKKRFDSAVSGKRIYALMNNLLKMSQDIKIQ